MLRRGQRIEFADQHSSASGSKSFDRCLVQHGQRVFRDTRGYIPFFDDGLFGLCMEFFAAMRRVGPLGAVREDLCTVPGRKDGIQVSTVLRM